MSYQRPVQSFPAVFEWQPDWVELFNLQVDLIQTDIKRARLRGNYVFYVSCPISDYGGGFGGTNVEIASHVVRRLSSTWGTRFWFLNPTQYQMESQQGLGLLDQHAKRLKELGKDIDLPKLIREKPAGGGDYMRMWTRVLVEDDNANQGERFHGYYFVGPNDVRAFFSAFGGSDLSAGVESYFARKLNVDSAFAARFLTRDPAKDEQARQSFFQYYLTKGGALYSRGSHDEWNIWAILNQFRLQRGKSGIGELLSGFYDGQPIPVDSCDKVASWGYGKLDVPSPSSST